VQWPLALVGPSGSGKSTLLRCIAGLYTPSEGRVTCNGETWLDTTAGVRLSPARRRIGMVFQRYALFPHLTALWNVLEAMDNPASPQARARALRLLAKVQVLVSGQAEETLTMSVPRHLVDRYAIAEGGLVALRLRGEHIQLMPAEGPPVPGEGP
jgi:ABC-type sulfate/molybdate transport systems ATPase subunit